MVRVRCNLGLTTYGGTAISHADAATGELLWVHREEEGKRGEESPRRLSGRGLAYWSDGKDERVYYVTIGYQLVALAVKSAVGATTAAPSCICTPLSTAIPMNCGARERSLGGPSFTGTAAR